jgi:type I restriction enzyme M protein
MDRTVIEKYLNQQKVKAVEKFDFAKSTISYAKEIKQARDIKKISGDEEVVRAYVLTKLVNILGYKPENIEIEKEYDIGRPKVNKPRIDVVVRDNNGNAFLYVELKNPEDYEKDKDEVIEKQLFNLASQEKGQGIGVKYLVLYSFDIVNDEIKDKCIIIDYEKYTSFDSWKTERNFADELPARYGKAQKEPFIKGGKKDLETNFTHEQLESLRKNLHNVLWGGGGTDDNEVFSSLTNLILAKIQDESEKKKNKKYDFQIFAYAKKGDEEFETKDQLFDRINTLYRRALKQRLNILDENKLKKSYVIDENKFSLAKLKYTVQELEKYSFVDGKNSFDGKDILGDFFEGIIREGFKQTKGQFFTHINVVRFLLWGLQLDKLALDRVNNDLEIPYLIDPSAGSGSFLIEYMKFVTYIIKHRYKDKIESSRNIQAFIKRNFYPDEYENMWAEKYIYGGEINPNLGTSIKVNMILHGDGSANIFVGSEKGDGLNSFSKYTKADGENILNESSTSEVYPQQINEGFDVIITNPPFSVDLDNETKKNVKKEFVFGDKKNSENLFIERWYQLLKPNGRFAAVLPESVFDTTENKYIRLFVYKYFKVKAVVSLPQVTFEPYTSTKTSLLFAQKKMPDEIEQWNELWSKYSNEWSLLKTRCEKEVEHFIKEKAISKKWAIAKETEGKRQNNLLRLLKDYLEEDDDKLSLKELVEKYPSEITELCKFDKDTTESFGFVNTWWVFGEVAKELNYSIFMAEVDHVGYKRTKRGEKPMPNDLYRLNADGEVMVNDGVEETALDFLRGVKWD